LYKRGRTKPKPKPFETRKKQKRKANKIRGLASYICLGVGGPWNWVL